MQSLAGAFKSIVLNHMSHFSFPVSGLDISFTPFEVSAHPLQFNLSPFGPSLFLANPHLLPLNPFSFFFSPKIATPSLSHLVFSPLYPYPLSVQSSTDFGLPISFCLQGDHI